MMLTSFLMHVQWLWTLLPLCSFRVGWVQAHQDKHGKVVAMSLDFNAELKVLADGLATDYFHEATTGQHVPGRNQNSFP